MMRFRLFLFLFALLAVPRTPFALTLQDVLKDVGEMPRVYMADEGGQRVQPSSDTVEKLRAVQIFVLPERRDEIDRLFGKWRLAGLNTVILRVFHNSDDRYHASVRTNVPEGVYYRTSRAPLVYDALGEIIPVARKHGLKVFAWMTTRYASYGTTGLERMPAYSFSQKRIVSAKGMDIFSPRVQQHIRGLFSDLASYDIDGILLQDDLFLKHNEGFSPFTNTEFRQEFGFPHEPRRFFAAGTENKPVYTDEFWTWQRWKSYKIAELVEKLNYDVKAKNPGIKLAVNLTYEAVSHPKGALAWLAHDLEQFRPVADYFSLMAYHRQIMEELKLSREGTLNYIADMVRRCNEMFPEDPERVLFKLQVKDWTSREPVGEDELRTLVRKSAGLDRLSTVIVPYPPDISFSLMQEIFSNSGN